jgi:hypothetical protein
MSPIKTWETSMPKFCNPGLDISHVSMVAMNCSCYAPGQKI